MEQDPIAVAVAAELARRGMSQNELAKTIGVAHPQISRWIQGARGIKLHTRTAVLDALGLEIVVRRRRLAVVAKD